MFDFLNLIDAVFGISMFERGIRKSKKMQQERRTMEEQPSIGRRF